MKGYSVFEEILGFIERRVGNCLSQRLYSHAKECYSILLELEKGESKLLLEYLEREVDSIQFYIEKFSDKIIKKPRDYYPEKRIIKEIKTGNMEYNKDRFTKWIEYIKRFEESKKETVPK